MATNLRTVIQSRMEREGLTYEQLAERVGISAATLNRMVLAEGKHAPQLDTLAKLGTALHIPLYELVEAVGFNLGLAQSDRSDAMAALYAMEHLSQEERRATYRTLPPDLKAAIAAVVEAIQLDAMQRLRG